MSNIRNVNIDDFPRSVNSGSITILKMLRAERSALAQAPKPHFAESAWRLYRLLELRIALLETQLASLKQKEAAELKRQVALQKANAQKLKSFVFMLNVIAEVNTVATPLIFLYLFKNHFSDNTRRNMMLAAGVLKLVASFGLFYARENPLLANDIDLKSFVVPVKQRSHSPRR